MIIIRQATESDIEQVCNMGQNVPEFSVSDETINFWPREIIENIVHSDEATLGADQAPRAPSVVITHHSPP
jgi:hypothetical protein